MRHRAFTRRRNVAAPVSVPGVPTRSDGRAYDKIVLGVPVKAQDYYSLSLRAGETVTVGLKGTADLELQNAAGVTVATAGGAANVNKVISDFVAPATGTYYARLSSGSFSPSDYALVVTRNAGFDTEANSTQATAQNLSATPVAGQQWALGHASGAVSPLDLLGTPVTGSLILTSDKISLGIQSDGSFIVGPTGIQFLGNEFVQPGTPLAGFVIGRDGQNFVNKGAIGVTDVPVALEDLSSGPLHGVRAVGIVGGNLRLERVVVFRDGDEFATIATRLTNVGGASLAGVSWLENLDPDQGEPLGAGFETFSDVVLGGELVRGHAVTGAFPDGLTIGLGSSDPRRVVSAEGFDNNDPFEIIDTPVDPDGAFEDIAINLAFNFGTLAPAQSVSGVGVMTFGRSVADAENTYSTNRGGTAQEDRDFYRVQVDANKTLAVQTIVPARRAGEVVNQLDPMVRIYSPSGALVASDDNSAPDGLNARVNYRVPRGAGGVYFIEVLASPATAQPTGGEYILTVKGASAPPAGGPLRAAGLPDGAPATRKLTVAAARTLLPEAVRAWRLAGYDTSALGRINIRVLDLGGDTLARASGNTIWLDDNAAGWGWFVDRTGRTDTEFLRAGNQGEQGRIDLLTVLIHEIGHLIGLGHAVDGAMLDELATGVRRRPEHAVR